MAKIIRVFPRRTSMTPADDYVFIGDPPLFRPDAYEVHVSCTFTWDLPEARRLFDAWADRGYQTLLGGPAICDDGFEFVPGRYVKLGITFTSRGCNNQCPWCLVPEREGKWHAIPIHVGNIIQDNNVLQADIWHWYKVINMLSQQKGIVFAGGLDARLLTYDRADDLRSLRIKQLFFACDTKQSLKALERAKAKLDGFTRNQLRCYVLLAFNGETLSEAQERLQDVWNLGFMPFAQLYQPPDKHIRYSREWRDLARTWSRPAAMKAVVKELKEGM